jgi:hypothetical protein
MTKTTILIMTLIQSLLALPNHSPSPHTMSEFTKA